MNIHTVNLEHAISVASENSMVIVENVEQRQRVMRETGLKNIYMLGDLVRGIRVDEILITCHIPSEYIEWFEWQCLTCVRQKG